MRARDYQHVEGSGVAILLGPDALELVVLADEQRLGHAGFIVTAGVKAPGAVEDRGAQVHGRLLHQRPAAPRQNAQGFGGAGSGPVDFLAGQRAPIVECAGVAVVARLAHASIQLDFLPIAQPGKRRGILGVERHLGARARLELQDEALALAGDSGRLDHAAAQDRDLAAGDVQLGRWAGRVREGRERAGGEESQQAAKARQGSGLAPQGEAAQGQERRDGRQKLGRLKCNETPGQDARGNAGDGPHQRIGETAGSDAHTCLVRPGYQFTQKLRGYRSCTSSRYVYPCKPSS